MYLKPILIFFQVINVYKVVCDLDITELNDYNYISVYASPNQNCISQCFTQNILLDDSNEYCNRDSLKNISNVLQYTKKIVGFEENHINISDAKEISRLVVKYYQNDSEYCEFTYLRTNCFGIKTNYTDSIRCQWWDENDLTVATTNETIIWTKLIANITNIIFVSVAAIVIFYSYKKKKKIKNHMKIPKEKTRRFHSVTEQLI